MMFNAAYFSTSPFRLARPVSKSLPTILSMLKTVLITFAMQGMGPRMAQVTRVASPLPCQA